MVQATAGDYDRLLAPEHQEQPLLTATVDLSVQPFVDEQNALVALGGDFDLDAAVGVQLDAVGVRVGRNRYVTLPLSGVYFAWDTANLGWDQGYWQGEFDPSTGVVALDDETYRLLLKAIIIDNSWDGTLHGAAAGLAVLFNGTITPGTMIFLEDGMDMTMTIGVVGTPPPAVVLALLISGEFGLKPTTVHVDYVTSTTALFGFDLETPLVSGWDVGSWAVPI